MLKKIAERVLWMKARDYVAKYNPLLVGVTGSYGKTLTKEAIAMVLSQKFNGVRAAQKSYNTPIGAALSVLGVNAPDKKASWVRLLAGVGLKEFIEEEPEAIVLELGADKPGDIDFLSSQLPFKIGVVTNVGSTHLRLFVNKTMVAHEKKSLLVTLPVNGTAILNADDALVMQMLEDTIAGIVTFGESRHADVCLRRAHRLGQSGFATEIAVNNKSYECSFPHLVGRHQLQSVLIALAVAVAQGIDIQKAINALRHLKPLAGRLRLLEGKQQSTILDDTYNASPESVMAGLNALAASPGKRKIAILGDMLDLGGETINQHQLIGEKVLECAAVFVGVGDAMKEAQSVALKRGNIDVHHFENSKDVGKWFSEYIHSGDVILVKGSRDMHMEETVRALLHDPKRDASKLVH